MKKIKDFIGDCIVELMVCSLYIICPFAILGGMCSGFLVKIKNKIT